MRDAIASALCRFDYAVDVADNGQEGWFLGSCEDYDAIVLDLNLPDLDGLAVLKRWRDENISTPVLVLTVRGKWLERVKGINLGADDYLAKPFQMAELIARLNAIIRRSKGHSSSLISCSGITVDMLCRAVTSKGKTIELSPLEWRVLSHLMQNKGHSISSHDLMEHVYGVNSQRGINALEALIKRLRQKLPTSVIRTRRGFGYLICDEDQESH